MDATLEDLFKTNLTSELLLKICRIYLLTIRHVSTWLRVFIRELCHSICIFIFPGETKRALRKREETVPSMVSLLAPEGKERL